MVSVVHVRKRAHDKTLSIYSSDTDLEQRFVPTTLFIVQIKLRTMFLLISYSDVDPALKLYKVLKNYCTPISLNKKRH